MKRYWLILLPLFLLACGVMALPATVGSSSMSESMPVFATQTPQISTGTPAGVILCVSAVQSLNLRIAPSTMAAGLDVLRHGDRVTVIGTGGSWYHIVVSDGRQGWVNASYLEECDG